MTRADALSSQPRPFTIDRTRLGATLSLAVTGDLDAATAPQLQSELLRAGIDCTRLVLDLTDLTFIDSVGLSVLLATKKLSERQRFELYVIPSEHDAVARVFALTESERALM
jgi:anti-sigma B factor antagonist